MEDIVSLKVFLTPTLTSPQRVTTSQLPWEGRSWRTLMSVQRPMDPWGSESFLMTSVKQIKDQDKFTEAELGGRVLCSSAQAPGWDEETRKERDLESCLEILNAVAWHTVRQSTVYMPDIKKMYRQDKCSGRRIRYQTRLASVRPCRVSVVLKPTPGGSWGDVLISFSLFSHLPYVWSWNNLEIELICKVVQMYLRILLWFYGLKLMCY